MNIAVFVGTRADLGPLEPVLAELGTDPQVRLEVLTGVAFDSAELAAYLSAALGITAEVVQLAPQMPTADAAGVTAQGELLVAGAHRYFAERAASAERSADALVVLGDRWELLFIVPQAYLHRVPIVHLHGGEVTEGALDERVRHAVTKLADVHCVASARAAIRVRQLGEPAASIHLTGAPGLDRIADAIPLQDDELRDRFGHALPRPLALFTYHPPTTTETGDPGRQAADALRGVLAHAGSVIVTAPGYDAGRDEIIAAIRELADGDPRIVYVESIGALFPRVLRAVDVVVGNSSSGIIEAPTALV
ncbi:MAG: UDP-N-acetylglucosamine 2-epimerase, partial [Actinobacteria bacterium]|nr:UDP-N-acetylglucosamine 2-epimerase [Actinomycetota bacterium]